MAIIRKRFLRKNLYQSIIEQLSHASLYIPVFCQKCQIHYNNPLIQFTQSPIATKGLSHVRCILTDPRDSAGYEEARAGLPSPPVERRVMVSITEQTRKMLTSFSTPGSHLHGTGWRRRGSGSCFSQCESSPP